MKCPKCSYVSFEYLDSCKKCGKDLFEFKEKAGISLVEPGYLDLNRFGNDGGSIEAATPDDTGDLEYDIDDEETEEAAPESNMAETEGLLDSLMADTGEEEDEITLEDDTETQQTQAEETPGLGIDEIEQTGAADGIGDLEGLDLTEDEDEGETDFSLSAAEGGGLATGSDEEISMDMDALEEEVKTEAVENNAIDLDLEGGSDGSDEDDEINLSDGEENDEIDFSVDLDEETDTSDNALDLSQDTQEEDEDITGEIELMLEDMDDNEPEPDKS